MLDSIAHAPSILERDLFAMALTSSGASPSQRSRGACRRAALLVGKGMVLGTRTKTKKIAGARDESRTPAQVSRCGFG